MWKTICVAINIQTLLGWFMHAVRMDSGRVRVRNTFIRLKSEVSPKWVIFLFKHLSYLEGNSIKRMTARADHIHLKKRHGMMELGGIIWNWCELQMSQSWGSWLMEKEMKTKNVSKSKTKVPSLRLKGSSKSSVAFWLANLGY